MAVSETDTDRLILEAYKDYATHIVEDVEKARLRQAICGTIGHELAEKEDALDWVLEMGRWNLQLGPVRIAVGKKKRHE